jgi:hypothetical protein
VATLDSVEKQVIEDIAAVVTSLIESLQHVEVALRAMGEPHDPGGSRLRLVRGGEING